MTSKTVVLSLPGTGFPDRADPITASFHGFLDPELFEARVVKYPASFGGVQPSFAVSRDAGRTALIEAVADCEGRPVVLSGYSQGAVVAGDLARETVLSARREWNVRACALIADGCRPPGVGLAAPGGRPAGGYGIAGARSIPSNMFPTFWVAAEGDPITALPAGSPLRTVADMVSWYSLSSPEAAVEWVARTLDAVHRGMLQDWWSPWKWRDWGGALGFLRGYLFDGRHTTDYIRLGHTAALAARLRQTALHRESS